MAIHDERRLKFGPDAVLLCLRAAGSMGQTLNLPSSNPNRVVFLPATQTVEAHYTVREVGGVRSVSSHLTAPQIAALLIGYCVSLHIPLPRKSTKRIMVESNGVTIMFEQMIEVGDTVQPRTGATSGAT